MSGMFSKPQNLSGEFMNCKSEWMTEVLKPEMTQVRQLWYTQLVEICVSLVV